VYGLGIWALGLWVFGRWIVWVAPVAVLSLRPGSSLYLGPRQSSATPFRRGHHPPEHDPLPWHYPCPRPRLDPSCRRRPAFVRRRCRSCILLQTMARARRPPCSCRV